MDTDVNYVLFCDGVAWEACKSNATEEVQSEYLKPINSLSAKSVLAGKKLIATYSISM